MLGIAVLSMFWIKQTVHLHLLSSSLFVRWSFSPHRSTTLFSGHKIFSRHETCKSLGSIWRHCCFCSSPPSPAGNAPAQPLDCPPQQPQLLIYQGRLAQQCWRLLLINSLHFSQSSGSSSPLMILIFYRDLYPPYLLLSDFHICSSWTASRAM